MSKEIDERVVEMRFDNKQFESNVQTTMSTLDKLKSKLNFNGVSKGFANISASAKNVNMSGLGGAVEAVSVKFSALEVMGVTALANITNSAVNAGRRMVSALTIDPVKTGLQEYETQINAVQTILANTQSKGSTIEDVNKALAELNKYADLTIYNFTEMTRNIGTFTAAGIDLDTSVNAIKGIANLAAVSGSTSQQASVAMYQLSQALASGTVKLMDWNSVVNAGMGGQVFQDALKETARVHGVAIDKMIEEQGSFRESLSKGWLTSEILTDTLQKFTLTTDGLTDAQIEQNREMLRGKGYTEEQIDEIFKLGKTATDAATKVKTFTQLWDVLKEAAQSGWAQTWQLIFGDFEEAKALFTPLSEFLTNIISKSADARNKVLDIALNSPFAKVVDKIKEVTKATETVIEATKDYGAIVDRVIGGEYGNGQSRWDKLTAEGYDWAHVQNLVNEKLNDSTRYATDYKETQNEVQKSQAVTIDQLLKMSDAQLKNKGFTEDEIKAFRELEQQTKLTGYTIEEVINNPELLNGRDMLIDSFKNIGNSLINSASAVKKAWNDIFHNGMTEDEIIQQKAERLYTLIGAFHKLTTYLEVNDTTAKNITRTFKGLFALLDIITTITGGGLKLGFKVLSKVLSAFNIDVLELTGDAGDMIVKFRDWLLENNAVVKSIDKMIDKVPGAVKVIEGWIDAFKKLPVVQDIIDNIKNINLSEVGKNIIDGLQNGLKKGITSVPKILVEIGNKLIESIKKVLGIHSPSKVMIAIGGFVIAGLVLGLLNGIPDVKNAMGSIGDNLAKTFGDVDWKTIFSAGLSVGTLAIMKKFADAFESLSAPMKGLGSLFEGTGEVLEKSAKPISKILKNTAGVVKSFSKAIKAYAFNMKTDGIKNIAISIGILAASIYLLAQLDTDRLWSAVGVITVLSAILIGLSFAVDKLSTASVSLDKKGLNINGLKSSLIGLGVVLLLMATTVKIIGSLNPEQAKQGFVGLTALVVEIIGFLAVYGLLVKGESARNIDKVGKMMIKLSVSLLVMVGVIKLISKISWADLGKGAVGILGFVGIVTLLTLISKVGGESIDKVGKMMTKMAVAMLLMVGVVKLIGLLSPTELIKGGIAMAAFAVFVGVLVAVTKIGKDKQIAKLGGLLLSISTTMLLMASVIKIVGGIEFGQLIQGAAGIIFFTVIIKALVQIVKDAGSDAPKIATTLLAMSVSIGILAGVAMLLGMISLPALAKGVGAVAVLGLIMAQMIKATKGASACKGNLIVMTVAIGVMAAAIAALSFIDPTRLAGATAALSIVMGMFSLIIKASNNIKSSLSSLIVMTAAIGLLGGIIYLLSSLPVKSVLGSATALSVLLLSLSASMLLISKSGNVNPTALISIGVMTLVIGALAGILYLMQGLPVEESIGTAVALGILLGVMSGACVVIGAISSFIPGAMEGVIGLGVVIGELAIVLAAFGALAQIPGLEWLISEGGNFLQSIGTAIGQFIGGIVAGVASGATSGLPDIGTHLSEFMTNVQPFIDGVTSINPSAMEGAKSLATMILMLTAADVLEGLASWFTGGNSLEDFADQLVPFGEAMVKFSNTVSEGAINPEAVNAAANAGEIMAEMANSLPGTDGVVQWFNGEKDMTKFGEQLKPFGEAMVEFSGIVSKEGAINPEAVNAAANAGKIMAEFQNTLTGTGGVVQWFSGEKDMAKFGEQLKSFGEAIVKFSSTVSEDGGINSEAITAAGNAGEIMANLQNMLGKTDGVVQWFSGEKDLAKFGTQLKAFGKALTDFSDSVSGENKIDEKSIIAAGNAGTIMANLQNALDNSGGVIQFFTGNKDLDDFGSQIVKFGAAIAKFSNVVQNTDGASIDDAVASVEDLVSIVSKLENMSTSGIPVFINGIAMLANADYTTFFEKVNVDGLSSAITNTNKLISMIEKMKGLDPSGAKAFTTSMKNLGSIDLSGFVSAVNNSSSKVSSVGIKIIDAMTSGIKTKSGMLGRAIMSAISSSLSSVNSRSNDYRQTGSHVMMSLISGVTSNSAQLKSTLVSCVSSAIASTREQYANSYSAGGYLVTGFANGISTNSFKAAAQAKAMAEAAIKAARAALKIHSPSKVFYEIGDYSGQGFVNALSDYGRKSYVASYGMADYARKGISNAINKVVDMLDGDMCIQPTITPVLDLSAVEQSVSSIDGLFNARPELGVQANLSSITSMMNNRQNGTLDVISAISDLKKSLSNAPSGNTYIIDGITYDDGSNVSEAVSALIQAARIERRK